MHGETIPPRGSCQAVIECDDIQGRWLALGGNECSGQHGEAIARVFLTTGHRAARAQLAATPTL